MPKGDYLAKGDKYLQELIQADLDVEDVGRWNVEVKELEES